MRRKNLWKILKKYFFEEYKELKLFFIVSILVILLSSLIGFTINPKIDVLTQAINSIENMAENIKNETFFSIAIFIFLNNLRSAALTVILGIFIVIPFISNISNGLLIGIVVKTKMQETGNKFLALQLIPHGILEIPAICLATALGVRLGVGMLAGNDKLNLLKKTLQTFIVIIIMLFFAALIEAAAF